MKIDVTKAENFYGLYRKLRKNLGAKNCEFSPEYINLITQVYLDFNQFLKVFDNGVKSLGLKLSSSEKNQIINAISWREESAEKVIKKVHKLKGEKLEKLLTHLEIREEYLSHFGYFESEKKGEYIEYESDSELRDTENVPLTDNIHDYFLREVLPHVSEAWIHWDKTNIGYEISFNKYFFSINL